MIGPGHPEGIVSLHPLVPDDYVLEGIVQRMTDMENPGDVRWGNNDGKRLLVTCILSMKEIRFEPALVPLIFDISSLICLAQFFSAHNTSLSPF